MPIGGDYTQNILSPTMKETLSTYSMASFQALRVESLGIDGNVLTNKLQITNHAVAGFEIDLYKVSPTISKDILRDSNS